MNDRACWLAAAGRRLVCVGLCALWCVSGARAENVTLTGPATVSNGASWTINWAEPTGKPGGTWTYFVHLDAPTGMKFIGDGSINAGAAWENLIFHTSAWSANMTATANNVSGTITGSGHFRNSNGDQIGALTVAGHSVQVGDPPPPPPTISVSAVPTSGDKPLAVAFTASVSNTDTVAWTFGDGGTGSGTSTGHTYTVYGSYTATATATGPGGTAQDSVGIVCAFNAPSDPDIRLLAAGLWSRLGLLGSFLQALGLILAFLLIMALVYWWFRRMIDSTKPDYVGTPGSSMLWRTDEKGKRL